jgi:hypothetical protein
MTLPIATNTTCDIYRFGAGPPAAPAVSGVAAHLTPDWRRGQEAGERGTAALTWTHVMLIDATVDIRDMYVSQSAAVAQDTVYVPDQNGTPFNVVFIELVQRGTPNVHKRVYLDRHGPTWPTNEL